MRSIALVPEATLLGPDDVARCASALQTQVSRDFAATWGIDARVRVTADPDPDDEAVYLLDEPAQANRLGCCPRTTARPSGYVFVRSCLENGESWQVTASHELLEMLADPLLNLGAEGIHLGRPAWFALEVCDPVERDEYDVAGIPVANFVLPTWFLPGPLPEESLVDFLGRLSDPFTLSPGGHAVYCTELGKWQAWFARRCPKHRRQSGPYSRRGRRKQAGVALSV